MVEFKVGDITRADTDAVCNTVNCVGAMGAGVALAVKKRWPKVYEAYRDDCGIGLACDGSPSAEVGPKLLQKSPPCCRPGAECAVHLVRPGRVAARETGELGVRFVLEVPTKRHWRENSRLEDVRAGLAALAETLRHRPDIGSVSVPALGCGKGGLDWRVVRPMMVEALAPLAARVVVYEPQGDPR